MRLGIILWLCLVSTPAWAIVNIEELRLDESVAGWKLSSTLSVSGKRGSVEQDKFALKGATQWVSADLIHRTLMLLDASVDKRDDETYAENYFIHLRQTRQLDELWALEALVQFQDEPTNNQYRRQLAGANMRYRLTQARFDGYAGLGLFYEQRYVIDELVGKQQEQDWRLNVYLNYVFPLSEHADWALSLYAQPAINQPSDLRSVINSGFISKVTQHFSLTFDISFSNESKPLMGQAYSEWEYGMGVNFRF